MVTHVTFLRFHFNAIIYISLISFFTVVALYPDLTQNKNFRNLLYVRYIYILCISDKCNVSNQYFSLM